MTEQTNFDKEQGIIYNITYKVEKSIAKAWLQWLLREHAPAMVSTECFTSFNVLQLLEIDDSEGPTYAVQYHAPDVDVYEKFINERTDFFQQQSFTKWGVKVLHFSTVMKIIQ